jgi:VanZ family protein
MGVGLVLLVIWLSLTPSPVPSGDFDGIDLGHLSAYFTLMLWWAQLVRAGWARVAVAVALVAMGIGLEFAQGLTTYRTFDVADMRDNAAGVAAGFVLALTPLGRVLLALERRLGVWPG